MRLCPTPSASPPLAPPRGYVGSAWGWRRGSHGQPDYHTGVDIGAPVGWPVLAMLRSTVVAAAPSGTQGFARYGNTVVLRHGELYMLFAHLDAFAPGLRVGSVIDAATIIGGVGRSAGTPENPNAQTRSPHLHLELLTRWPPRGRDLDRIDPAPALHPLGIILAPRSPLRVAPGSRADEAVRCLSRINGSTGTSTPAPSTDTSGVLWLLLALLFGGDLF